MAIAPSQIEYRLSVPDGSSGDSLPSSAAGQSLGRWVSRSVIPGGIIGNLFPNATPLEFLNNQVDYQCMFVVNRHPTITLQDAVAWLAFQKPGGHTVDIAPDDTAPASISANTPQALSVTNKNTAPALVAPFTSASEKTRGIMLGSIGPNQAKAIWFRRAGTFDGVAQPSSTPPTLTQGSGTGTDLDPSLVPLNGSGTLTMGRPAVCVLGGVGVLSLAVRTGFTTVPLSGVGQLFINQGVRTPRFYGHGSLTLRAMAALAYVAAQVPDSVILRVEGFSPA